MAAAESSNTGESGAYRTSQPPATGSSGDDEPASRALWRWIKRVLLGGFGLWLVLKALDAIWQVTVQDWWKADALPWLASPLSIEVNWGTAIVALILVSVSQGSLSMAAVIFYRGRRFMARRVRELEATLGDEQTQVLNDYAWEFVSIIEQWGRSLAIVKNECPVANDDGRKGILQRLVDQVVWDCARLIGENIVVSGSVALSDPARSNYLALVHVVGVAEDRKEVRHFYVGNDSTLSDQHGVAGHAFKTEQTVIVADIFSDPRYAWHAGDARPRSAVPYAAIAATPLVCEDHVVGVLCLDGRMVNCFNEERVRPIIEYAAKYLAEALEACAPLQLRSADDV